MWWRWCGGAAIWTLGAALLAVELLRPNARRRGGLRGLRLDRRHPGMDLPVARQVRWRCRVGCCERKLCANSVGPTTATLVSAVFLVGGVVVQLPPPTTLSVLRAKANDLCLDRMTAASSASLAPWSRRLGTTFTSLVMCCLGLSVTGRCEVCGLGCGDDGGGRPCSVACSLVLPIHHICSLV